MDVKGVDPELIRPERRLVDAFHALVNFIAHWLTMPPTCLHCGTTGQATAVELQSHGCLMLHP